MELQLEVIFVPKKLPNRSGQWLIFILILLRMISFSQQQQKSSEINFNSAKSLDNQHVVVAAIEVPADFILIRNSTGHVVHSEGIVCHMIDWLSVAYVNSTYSLIPINIKTRSIDSSGNVTGIVNSLHDGDYDIMTACVPTPSRSELVDFTNPILYLPVSYLIPLPISVVNVLSLLKPFQIWVWVGIFVSIPIIIISLKLIMMMSNITSNYIMEEFSLTKTVWIVLGLLLHQVGYGLSSRFSIRIVIASWSLAVLVLIHLYTCLFTAFLTAPNPQPLIQSIYDLKDRPEIRLVTDKNLNTEAVLLSANSGILKMLGDRLRADPQSSCLNSSQCVSLVKKGHSVYTATRDGILSKALRADLKERSDEKCNNLQIGRDSFMELQISWAVQKKSPILDPLNKSIMRMAETGLLLKWSKDYMPKVEQCFGGGSTASVKKMRMIERIQEEHINNYASIINGLSGPFILFFAGVLVSWLALFAEFLSAKCN